MIIAKRAWVLVHQKTKKAIPDPVSGRYWVFKSKRKAQESASMFFGPKPKILRSGILIVTK